MIYTCTGLPSQGVGGGVGGGGGIGVGGGVGTLGVGGAGVGNGTLWTLPDVIFPFSFLNPPLLYFSQQTDLAKVQN